MSRIGNKEIKVPDSVNIQIQDKNFIVVKGPQGKLEYQFNHKIKILLIDNIIKVSRPNNELFMKKIHGTTRALLSNMIEGVEKGFVKCLEIVGLDYKVDLKDEKLILHLGFSHPIEIKIPKGIDIEIPKKIKGIRIKGIDKQFVGEFASKIAKLRKPEPYKGKGIRFEGQYVIRKAGKSTKK
ncbi:MAG: 50S ribosomal protein L6 [Candidatus Phytoplasma pyri]|uniref:50S ribosomal protein L6 n=1 Tax=Candidatus Phytoplasma pyri TaxID=47566 RepID=UPI003983A7D2